jgi:hypothetical protein
MKRTAAIACCVCLGWAAPAGAHRLDEYLQATRIAFGDHTVDVEIDLSPGVRVAPQVVALIDTDRDGALSRAEQHAYAALVVKLASLTLDGTAAPLALVGSEYPSVAEMRAGTGTIHLRARWAVQSASAGGHELTYVNVHQPEMSAYLVNVLAPPSGIRITGQQRDPWQRQLRLEYVVDAAGGAASRLAAGLGVGCVMMCALGWFRRSSVRAAFSHDISSQRARGTHASVQK